MKLTVAHLLELIDELPKGIPFEYVKPGKNKSMLLNVDKEKGRVEMARVSSETNEQSTCFFTEDHLQTIADSVSENKPFVIDKIFNNGGNTRSVWESILANTSEFYKCMVQKNKNLVWVPTKKGNAGTVEEISYAEIPVFESEETEITRNIREEFSYFLSSCVKSNRTTNNSLGTYGNSAVGSYLSMLDKRDDGTILLFDYNPQKWKHIQDVYKITDPAHAEDIYNQLLSDNEFVSRNFENNNNWRAGALNLYVLFLRARKYFSRVSTTSNKITKSKTLSQNVTHLPYLTALRTKPFMLLAGISGTGKSRIVREMAFKTCPKYLQDKDGTTPGNYCMIEVKPNWHDSTELIGYYSNLSQSYQFKKFVKFLVKAQMNPEVPFFVCLDEMNLAPVEQYFAEILSILETRKHPKKDGVADMEIIKTEVIVENRYFTPSWKDKDNAVHEKIMSDADWYKEFFDIEKGSAEEIQVQKYQDADTLRTEGLKLPDNVFIIGTVNMDDTTHPFSRKVIDRAMTIEMNGGRLSDMFGGSRDLEYIEDEKIQKEWQQAFHQHYVTADEVLEEHPEYAEMLKEKLPVKLDAINKALKGTPFEVSYRVLNELTIMVGVMLDDKKGREDIDIDGIINHAVDNILLMKILPRIEGDADMFYISDEYKKENDIPYDNRLEWLKDIAPDIKAVTTSEEDNSDSTNEDQPTAKKKIKEMIDRLTSQEFTRFWP